MAFEKLQNSRNALGIVFMLPAAVLLLLFLTYPLGLGAWLGFTDAKVGRQGVWVGLENYEFLWGDQVTRLGVTRQDAVDQAFQICQRLERRTELSTLHSIVKEILDAVLPALDAIHVEERLADPLMDHAFAHGCNRPVERAEQ